MLKHYIIDKKGKVKVEKNIIKWARWFENTKLRFTKVTLLGKKWRVSSVFLGLDHRFYGRGKPILWETMVFEQKLSRQKPLKSKLTGRTLGGFKYHKSLEDYTGRHTSKASALKYHNETVEKLEKKV